MLLQLQETVSGERGINASLGLGLHLNLKQMNRIFGPRYSLWPKVVGLNDRKSNQSHHNELLCFYTGFFIFLTFVARKRIIALLRGLRNNHHESGQENNDTLDTKLWLSFSLSSAAFSEHKTRLRLCIVIQPLSTRGKKDHFLVNA